MGDEIPNTLRNFIAESYSSQVSYLNSDSTLSVVAYASERDLAYNGGISPHVLK